MAGTHLADSLRALRDAGSADALYTPSLRATDPDEISYEEFSLARDEAEGWRVTYSRRALLFAAFAAEAYANDFLYKNWSERRDRDALQKLLAGRQVCAPASPRWCNTSAQPWPRTAADDQVAVQATRRAGPHASRHAAGISHMTRQTTTPALRRSRSLPSPTRPWRSMERRQAAPSSATRSQSAERCWSTASAPQAISPKSTIRPVRSTCCWTRADGTEDSRASRPGGGLRRVVGVARERSALLLTDRRSCTARSLARRKCQLSSVAAARGTLGVWVSASPTSSTMVARGSLLPSCW